jgi:hypothetical protein
MPLRTELKGVHYPSLIASEDTQTHAALKRPISGVYSMSNVTKSESFINECILQLVEMLDQEFSAKGDAFPVFSWMHFCRSMSGIIREQLLRPAQLHMTPS